MRASTPMGRRVPGTSDYYTSDPALNGRIAGEKPVSPLLAIWRIRQVTASTSYAFAKNAHRRESRRCESTPKLPSAHVLVRNKVPSSCKVKSSVTRRVRLRLLRGSKYARLATYTVGSSVHTCHSATCATVFSVLTILSSQQKKMIM